MNDLEKFIKPCLVYPSSEKWNMLTNEHTYLIVDAARAVSELGGFAVKANEKK